jgi:3-methyladenine DNA glycosylase AlkD
MSDQVLTPSGMARRAVRRLRAQADPVRAAGASRYFKHTIRVFGATAPQVRALAAELYRSVKGRWTAREAVRLCDLLFAEPELESKAVGALVLARFKTDFPRSLFSQAKAWLAASRLDNWASVDVFCTESLGALLEKYPDLVGPIRKWAFHPNRWVKRASAVSFIKLARKPPFLGPIYRISASLFPVDDDLVQKANGWLLREAGKADTKRLERFLLEHGPAVPRTTLRYAIERFPEARRRGLLAATRGSAQ